VPIPKSIAIIPSRLADVIAAEGVTTIFLTTALFNAVARDAPDAFRSCRTVLFGGETVEPSHVRAVLFAGRPERLVHVYGPTETTTFATACSIDAVRRECGDDPDRPRDGEYASVASCAPDRVLAAPGELGRSGSVAPRVALGISAVRSHRGALHRRPGWVAVARALVSNR
jgi:acyl-CoA synthetase (AMP-forming)/AMP-acid ligase II